jgi:hypothetical protein
LEVRCRWRVFALDLFEGGTLFAVRHNESSEASHAHCGFQLIFGAWFHRDVIRPKSASLAHAFLRLNPALTAVSLRKQPQLRVTPQVKLVALTIVFVPQSHWQNHLRFLALVPCQYRTNKRPKRSPLKSNGSTTWRRTSFAITLRASSIWDASSQGLGSISGAFPGSVSRTM